MFDKVSIPQCPHTSDKGGGTTLVRLCLARVFFVRCCVSARLQLQQPNTRRQIAPHLLSGGQQTVGSAGATLDFLVQHLTSCNPEHLLEKYITQCNFYFYPKIRQTEKLKKSLITKIKPKLNSRRKVSRKIRYLNDY